MILDNYYWKESFFLRVGFGNELIRSFFPYDEDCGREADGKIGIKICRRTFLSTLTWTQLIGQPMKAVGSVHIKRCFCFGIFSRKSDEHVTELNLCLLSCVDFFV